ncbi:MAG: alpha/beta hydrolase [Microbacteriaceae bacterium]|nr:alpha/beta hydrolase [Microbacteriaceae bacterium]
MTIESPYAAQLAAIPVRVRNLTVQGDGIRYGNTRYWDYGDADAATTVVLVHGFRGDHHGIEPIVAQLPGIRFISPDLPGFGESDPFESQSHSVESYRRWLTAFVSQLGLSGSASILGHSFGSILVASAVANGLETNAVILVNPIAISGLKGPNRIGTAITVGYYWLAGHLPVTIGTRLLNSPTIVRAMSEFLVKSKRPKLRRWIHEEHARYFSAFASRTSVVEGFHATVSTDVSAFAARITAPTLLIAARLDDITPVAAQSDLQRLFPQASLVVLDDVGHLIHYEVPQLAAEAITAFLAGLPRGPRPGA